MADRNESRREEAKRLLDDMIHMSEVADAREAQGVTIEILDPDPEGGDSLNGLWPTDELAAALEWAEKTVAQINAECPEYEPCTYRPRLVFES